MICITLQWKYLYLCNIPVLLAHPVRLISATPSQIKRYLSPSIKSQLMCNPSMFSHRMGLLDSTNTRFFFCPNINSIFMHVILFQPKLRTLRDWRCLVCSMQKEVIWLYSRFNVVSFRNDFVKYAKTPFIWFIVRDIEIKCEQDDLHLAKLTVYYSEGRYTPISSIHQSMYHWYVWYYCISDPISPMSFVYIGKTGVY